MANPISTITGLATESSDVITSIFVVGVLIAFYAVLILAIYIYSSFAFMAIAKKAKHPKPWLAWIPWIGKPLLTSQIAKMHWWPILFIIPMFVALTFLPVAPILSIILIILAIPFSIVLFVFYIIWQWKTFEAVGHPGWFVLFIFVSIVYFVFLGIVAWSGKNIIEQKRARRK